MDISFTHNGRKYTNFSSEDASNAGIPQSVIDAAIAEQQWEKIREKRDALLRDSDYAVMPDYPLSDDELAAVKQYRQALRDIPETADDPDTIEWPEKPEVLA